MAWKSLPLLVIPILLFFCFIFYIYYQRVGAFGCFDDCFNIGAGYFILQGKILYSEIFFNHQPLMAYISAGIQAVSQPESLYKLILYHRLFLFTVSLVSGILLTARFGFPALGFILFYESIKFYTFGDRFLAESVLVYPLVYLIGLLWQKLQKKKMYNFEYVVSAFFAWFIIFMREPFAPVAVGLLILLLLDRKFPKTHRLSLLIFSIILIFPLFFLPFSDYFFNVIHINLTAEVGTEDFTIMNIIKIFGYPLYLLVSGASNYFHTILVAFSLLFTVLCGFWIFRLKRVKEIILIIFVLGLTNIRFVEPGSSFYETFHMSPWLGSLLILTFFLLQDLLMPKYKRYVKYTILFIAIGFSFVVLNPFFFAWEKIDKNSEFATGYGHYFANGEVIRLLSNKDDTLFVDGFDEIIYWQAGLSSSYKYSWYTSIMPYFPLYANERIAMFKNTPPDFYYGTCPEAKNMQLIMPEDVKADYQNLYFANSPTCIFVRKEKLTEISNDKWEQVKKLEFHLPEVK